MAYLQLDIKVCRGGYSNKRKGRGGRGCERQGENADQYRILRLLAKEHVQRDPHCATAKTSSDRSPACLPIPVVSSQYNSNSKSYLYPLYLLFRYCTIPLRRVLLNVLLGRATQVAGNHRKCQVHLLTFQMRREPKLLQQPVDLALSGCVPTLLVRIVPGSVTASRDDHFHTCVFPVIKQRFFCSVDSRST